MRLDARWLNFEARGAAWWHFWQDSSAAGGQIISATATVGAVGALTAGALLVLGATASAGGVGDLSAQATLPLQAATASLPSLGAITAQGQIIKLGSASLPGLGGLSADGSLILPGSVDTGGLGTLAATVLLERQATASLPGAGGTAAEAVPILPAAAIAPGQGDLSAAGVSIPPGTVHEATVELAMMGGIVIPGVEVVTGAGPDPSPPPSFVFSVAGLISPVPIPQQFGRVLVSRYASVGAIAGLRVESEVLPMLSEDEAASLLAAAIGGAKR